MDLKSLRQDLPAGIVVFFVAVPLCLGIALASGAPLISGLLAGIVGGIVVGAFSRSQLGVSGPAAGLAVIVLGAINELGFEMFLVAVVLAGVIQIALGLGRAGLIAYFFPSSVIKGMLAGIGVIIVLKQIPHAFGHDSDPEGEMAFVQPDGETTISSLMRIVGDFNLSATIVAMVCLAILVLWESVISKRVKALAKIPAPLLAVLFGIGFQAIATAYAPERALEASHRVNVPIASGFGGIVDLLTWPDWSGLTNPNVLVTAVVLAVVASLETLLCVEATDKLDPLKRVTPTNRELIAQGIGNSVVGLIGGLPVTQVIVRSSANIQSGGRTKLSAIFHGVLMMVFVFVFPQLLNMIPLAALASILLVVGYKLARPSLFKKMWSEGMTQFIPFAVTVLGIVFTDLLTGISLGLAVGIFHILRRSFLNSHFLHVEESAEGPCSKTISMRLAEEVTFLNRGAIVRALADIPDGVCVRIDTSDTIFMDDDVKEVLADFRASIASRNLTVEFIERRRPDDVALAG